MGIVDEDIVRVREATDIVALITQYTQLKRVGQRWSGLCPFHSEKTPSFSVNASEGFYYCFGCKEHGDAITFVRNMEHLDFVGAVERLAGTAGIVLRYTDQNEGAGRKRQKELQAHLERAVDWYHERLKTSPDAAAARAYLRSRGFTGEQVARYQVGWAPDDWDQLAKFLKISNKDLEAVGLGFVNRRQKQQDFFRARVLFPIFDEQGRPVGFGGRKLPDAEGPKYQNSRDNELYNKSKALYGINWAKADMVQHDEVVICEGYTDVIGFGRAGVDRAVATCGTALTEEHVRLLRKFTRRLVLAYDADEAGQSASERVYAWEKAYEVQVSVVQLQPGEDPDEMARENPEALRAAVADARPFLAFRVERVLGAADLSTPEGRARAAEHAVEVVAEHPDPIVRDQYVMEVADECRVAPDLLRTRLTEVLARPRDAAPARRGASGPSARQKDEPFVRGIEPLHGANGGVGNGSEWDDAAPPPWETGGSGEYDAGEYDDSSDPGPSGTPQPRGGTVPPLREGSQTEALRLALARPEEVATYLDGSLFLHPTARAAFDALANAATVTDAIAAAGPEAGELLTRLSFEPTASDAVDVVARLAEEVGRQTLVELEAEARGADDPLAYGEVMRWLKLTLEELRSHRPEVEKLNQLVDWLIERRRESGDGLVQ